MRIDTTCNISFINLRWFIFFFFFFTVISNFLYRKHGRYKTIYQRHFMSQKDTCSIGVIIWNWGFYYGPSHVQGSMDAFYWGKFDTMLRANILLQFFKKERRIGQLSLGKFTKFAKAIFYFLKAAKENRY